MRSYVTVSPPLPHEGIVNALRSSFHVAPNGLPSDMLALLGRLDGK